VFGLDKSGWRDRECAMKKSQQRNRARRILKKSRIHQAKIQGQPQAQPKTSGDVVPARAKKK
jgi:hypothetical protein